MSASSAPLCAGRAASRRNAPFGLPGRARGVDHRRPGLGRPPALVSGSLGDRGGDQLVDRCHARRRRAVEHEDRARTFGMSARIAGEHRRELGVDVDDRRVAVVDDVGRLLVDSR